MVILCKEKKLPFKVGHYEQKEVIEALGIFTRTPAEQHLEHSEDWHWLIMTGRAVRDFF